MKSYRHKVTCEAEPITKELYDFLVKEGWNASHIDIGDYYIKSHNGEYTVWNKNNFEALYEEVI